MLVRRAPQGPGVRVGAGGTTYGTTSEVDFVPPSEVDLMDVSPKQIVSISTALIPFIEHDDANRALMGANMQKQAVPLVRPEAPFVGTGVEGRAARDTGDVLLAEGTGTVVEISGEHVTVEYKEGQTDRYGRPLGRKMYPVYKFRRSNQNTCFNQRIVVEEGQPVGLGDVLADGPSTEGGELGLGKNLLVAFMPWEGYNYEDAIILSERLVRDDVLSSIHIEEHEVDARDTKLGAEEITRDIPNLSEEILKDLDERGIIRIGRRGRCRRRAGGQGHAQGRDRAHARGAPAPGHIRRKGTRGPGHLLKVPHGESGKVIDVRVFSREDAHELPPGVNQLVRVYVAQKRKITEGDKLAGRHGNKGVISKILPVEDMPHLADGTPVDMILNPLGRAVPDERGPGPRRATSAGPPAGAGTCDGRGPTVTADRARKTSPVAEPATASWRRRAFDGAHWDEEDQAGKHPTIKKIFENLHPEAPGTEYGDGGRLIGSDGKAVLYNGRTGEPYDNPVSVGYIYIMKLAHLVDDKIHARSTGPYSMITQQPLGGKAQFGGQRFGEMEVWALEAYGAAYALQELLTIKSDDVLGRGQGLRGDRERRQHPRARASRRASRSS